jgi:hypothetical protein
MAESYLTCNYHEHTAQFRFNQSKVDQALPVSIFIRKSRSLNWSGVNMNTRKTATTEATTTTRAASAAASAVVIRQQRRLLLLLIKF